MKKKVITMAVIFASLLSYSAVAQNNITCPSGQQTEQCGKQKRHHGKHSKRQMRERGVASMVFNALNGIDLSDEQKVRLFDLREKYTTIPANNQNQQQEIEPRQRCENLITEIKTILTENQTKQFEENLKKMKTNVKRNRNNGQINQCVRNQPCQQGDSVICIKKKR